MVSLGHNQWDEFEDHDDNNGDDNDDINDDIEKENDKKKNNLMTISDRVTMVHF